MIDPSIISIGLGLFVGILLAITGAGGTILSLPLLVFSLNLSMVSAAPIALLAVMLSASVATAIGLREGIVRYKAASLLAACGVVLAPVGVWLAQLLPEQVLAILFATVLVMVAWRAFQKSSIQQGVFQTSTCRNLQDENKPDPTCIINPATSKLFWTAPCAKRLIFTGGLAGFLSGLLGVGGGFIIVPTLHQVSNLETKMVVATSLAVIAIVSMASALSYAGYAAINWHIAIPFTSGMLVGMLLGRLVADKISSQTSQRVFALLVSLIAIAFVIKTLLASTKLFL